MTPTTLQVKQILPCITVIIPDQMEKHCHMTPLASTDISLDPDIYLIRYQCLSNNGECCLWHVHKANIRLEDIEPSSRCKFDVIVSLEFRGCIELFPLSS